MDYHTMQALQRSPWADDSNPVYDTNNPFLQHHQTAMMPSFNRQMDEPRSSASLDSLGIRVWPTSMPQTRRPHMQRPVTIHEGAFPTDFSAEIAQPKPTTWNNFGLRPNEHFGFHPTNLDNSADFTAMGNLDGLNGSKPVEDNYEFPNLDTDFSQFAHDMASNDENGPIINLRKLPPSLDEPLNLDTTFSRRYSGSSFVSSTGAQNDIPDISAYSEVPSYASDYTPRSSLNLSATPLSPVPSPRYAPHSHDVIRAGSRSRASPSPRPSMRAAPYTLDGRNKRWSTGSFGNSPARRSSPFVFNAQDSHYAHQVTQLSRITSPVAPPASSFLPSNNLTNVALRNSALQTPPRFHRPTAILPSNFDSAGGISHPYNPVHPPPLPSHHSHLFRTLTSNADPHLQHHLDQYACLSDPPDLFGSLSEEPIPPPPEDMNPSDPELVPHEQELRFENDLYTPRWVRGHGNKREGWCGICKPGRWLVLKNSAFWYDKSFTHGVSAATGQAFEGPKETRRMEGNADVWEGLCSSCSDWIALVSSKKKGTTWFRHAYKCHSHPKIKDAPKRRRESSHTRPSTSSSLTPKAATSASSLNTENLAPGVKTISPLHSISSMI